jgi:gliding motility-associated-like protein
VGDSISIVSVTPNNGTITVNPIDSTITYVPNADFNNGCDQVKVVFQDKEGLSDSLYITYVIPNKPPFVIRDTFYFDQGQGGVIDFVFGDTDGDSITLLEIDRNVFNGQSYMSIDSTIDFSPNKQFYGWDSVNVLICDTAEVCENTGPICVNQELIIYVKELKVVPTQGVSVINQDGINDTWIIRNIELYQNNKVRIYNRWGNLVWEESGYDNENVVWVGKSNVGGLSLGTVLPDATYFFTIELNDEEGSVYNGFVVLK